MKEETNDNGTHTTPTEAQMNDMHKDAWLNFHVDAQQAKQDINRRYAKMVEQFGSYRKMPEGVKEILQKDYSDHKAKWGENGTEQQKRFGLDADNPAVESKSQPAAEQDGKTTNKEQPKAEQEKEQVNAILNQSERQAMAKEQFLQKAQAQRQRKPNRQLELEY